MNRTLRRILNLQKKIESMVKEQISIAEGSDDLTIDESSAVLSVIYGRETDEETITNKLEQAIKNL